MMRLMRSPIATRVACALAALAVAGTASLASAQDVRASISGAVTSADGRDAVGTQVTLLDQRGTPIATTTTNAAGRFTFPAVAPGAYRVVARDGASRSLAPEVVVTATRTYAVALTLTPGVDESLVVRGGIGDPAPSTMLTLSQEALQALPARLGSRALPQMLATLPGWSSEDNGLLHVRGVDDGFLYVEDGVPVYDRIDAVFGIAPSAATIDTMNVLTGYIPAEHGMKAGAVIEVHSTSKRQGWAGTATTGGGSNRTATGQATAGGPLTKGLGVGASVVSERSDRFLDPIHPGNFHNRGGTVSATVRLEGALSDRDRLLVTATGGGAGFEVPHGTLQEAAGQDQRQRLRQQAQSSSWQRVWTGTTVTHAAAYRRRINARLDDTLDATPLHAESNRTHERFGSLASVSMERGRHTLKAGGEAARLALDEQFLFAVTDLDDAKDADLSDAALAFTLARPFRFDGTVTRWQASAYVQDRIRISDAISVDVGVRADRTRLLVPASQWSPRVGVAWRLDEATTVRAAYNRFFQPPQPEHLLLSSSPAARALSPFADDDDPGGAEVPPERTHAWELGVERLIAGVSRLSGAAWRRDVTNYADPNVFFGTTIVFPNSVARGTAQGLDLRLDVPRWRGWSAALAYTLAKVEQTGPINGGLFLEDEIDEIGPGVTFTPDHDQRHAASALVTYSRPTHGLSLTTSVRYESGTPVELGDLDDDDLDDLLERPGVERVDLDRGRVKPRLVVDLGATARLRQTEHADVSLKVTALNVFDRAYAFNFGNPFSGTHFGAPRQVRVDLQVRFE
jgi:outer membrane receptor for ferrienterochelin and colicin